MTVAGGLIHVVPVQTKAELTRFIRVPMRLGAGDPNYVPPLMFERRDDVSSCSYFYLDKAESDLPALMPFEKRKPVN